MYYSMYVMHWRKISNISGGYIWSKRICFTKGAGSLFSEMPHFFSSFFLWYSLGMYAIMRKKCCWCLMLSNTLGATCSWNEISALAGHLLGEHSTRRALPYSKDPFSRIPNVCIRWVVLVLSTRTKYAFPKMTCCGFILVISRMHKICISQEYQPYVQ